MAGKILPVFFICISLITNESKCFFFFHVFTGQADISTSLVFCD